MDLTKLTDESLHTGNIRDAAVERGRLVHTLHRLLETERRRLFSKHKCTSLYNYATKFMNYSHNQAETRIKSMRVLRNFPEIEEKIDSGALNVTNLSLAQRLFLRKKKTGHAMSPSEKRAILAKIENQSTRAAQKIIFGIEPSLKPNKNALDFNSIEDESLREKLLQLKGRFAHSNPDISLNELLHKMSDIVLDQKFAEPKSPKLDSQAEVHRQVWRRDGGKCTNCGSTHALQIEHKIPKATGGPSTLENLCLLCRSCNQRRAIEFYGLPKMEEYLRSPVAAYGARSVPVPALRLRSEKFDYYPLWAPRMASHMYIASAWNRSRAPI